MELTSYEESMIRNMMLSKSHREISKILDISIDETSKVISAAVSGSEIVTFQMKLDDKQMNRQRAASLRKKPVIDVARIEKQTSDLIQKKRDKEKSKQHRLDNDRRVRNETKLREQSFKTRDQKLFEKVLVRIDHKTFIYARPGEEESAKKNFLKHYKKPLQNL